MTAEIINFPRRLGAAQRVKSERAPLRPAASPRASEQRRNYQALREMLHAGRPYITPRSEAARWALVELMRDADDWPRMRESLGEYIAYRDSHEGGGAA